MVRNQDFEIAMIGDEHIAIPIGAAATTFKGVVVLSEAAAFLLGALSEPLERDDLVQKLLGEYDVDRATAERDVDDLIGRLTEYGLIRDL